MDKTNLPPLPRARFTSFGSEPGPRYTAEQMHEYAARAVREAVPESVDARVSGYLSREKAVEVVIDAGIPAWLIRSVGYRVRISAAPTQDQENGS